MNDVIGVIVSRVQGEACKSFLGTIFSKAKDAGYRVCVFHSVYDFGEDKEAGAAGVFNVIPFNKLCALIILHDAIYDGSIIENIIDNAEAHNCPVILAKGINSRCYSIVGNFQKPYRDLIRKVIVDRNADDVFFIAGRKNHGEDSVARLKVFEDVCKEMGIPFDDTKLAYGEYSEKVVKNIIDELLSDGKIAPKAIFCANDIMALAAIDGLTKYGFSVPIDTVVVGFDGLETAHFAKPKITTCVENMNAIATLSIRAIEDAIENKIEPRIYYYEYEAIYSESAGYFGRDLETTRLANEIFRRFRNDENDEEILNRWFDNVSAQQNLDGLQKNLPKLLEKDRCFIVRTDPYWEMVDERAKGKFPREVLLLSNKITDGIANKKQTSFDEAIEFMMDSVPFDSLGYVSTISMHDLVYGIAFTATKDPYNNAGRMNRFAFTMNRAFSLAINGEKQLYLAQQISRSRYNDPVTDMSNMDGANQWYYRFVNSEKAKKGYISIGVYRFMNHQELMGKEGIDFIEEVLQFIANTLVLVNPDKEMIARVSNSSFAVVNYYLNGETNAEQIDQATLDFYQILDIKKKTADIKWRNIEVSCGYFVTRDGDTEYDDFTEYIDAANTRLYRNRNYINKNLPKTIDPADGNSVIEYKSRLITLLKENLFNYNFQPIVDVYTAEIVAYEGLMRTSDKIDMSPLEVLGAANMFEKSQDIEYASFFNIYTRMQAEADKFEGKKIFINTVPGWFLNEEQLDDFRRNFPEQLKNTVVEITEAETINADELDKIRDLRGDGEPTFIAIDDYGTGHSNIVNLLEYKPQYIKIDRYLISNINEDKNKQLFVKNLIEFAKENGILVLAEGVETKEEMETVITFGVDLIQGYYTARPSIDIVQSLPEDIVNEILSLQKK